MSQKNIQYTALIFSILLIPFFLMGCLGGDADFDNDPPSSEGDTPGCIEGVDCPPSQQPSSQQPSSQQPPPAFTDYVESVTAEKIFDNGQVHPDSAFKIVFTQPMDNASFEERIHLISNIDTVSLELVSSNSATEFKFNPSLPLKAGAEYFVRIASDISTTDGVRIATEITSGTVAQVPGYDIVLMPNNTTVFNVGSSTCCTTSGPFDSPPLENTIVHKDVVLAGHDGIMLIKNDRETGQFTTSMIADSSITPGTYLALGHADVNDDQYDDLVVLADNPDTVILDNETIVTPNYVIYTFLNQRGITAKNGGFVEGGDLTFAQVFEEPTGIKILPFSQEHVLKSTLALSDNSTLGSIMAIENLSGEGSNPDVILSDNNSAEPRIIILPVADEGIVSSGGDSYRLINGIPQDFFTADIDQDNDIDLSVVTLNSTTSTSSIEVFKNNGSGGFSESSPTELGNLTAAGIAVADLDGDGVPDLAISDNSTSDGKVLIYLNNSGNFPASPSQQITVGKNPGRLRTGHFNNDRFLDLAVLNRDDNNVSILFGDGNGDFRDDNTTVAVGQNPKHLELTELDNAPQEFSDLPPQNNDLLIVSDTGISILTGNADGQFGTQGGISATSNSSVVNSNLSVIKLMDVDNNDIFDFVVADQTNNMMSSFKGNGNGGFIRQDELVMDKTTIDVIPEDFDGNGQKDDILSILGNGRLIFFEDGSLNASGSDNVSIGGLTNHPIQAVSGDFNKDNQLDVMVLVMDSSTGEGKLRIVLNKGTEPLFREEANPDGTTLNQREFLTGGINPVAIASGLFGEDQNSDVVVVHQGDESVPGNIWISYGTHRASFTDAAQTISQTEFAPGATLKDVAALKGRDGKTSAIAVIDSSSLNADNIYIFQYSGDSFKKQKTLNTSGYAVYVAAEDLNSDSIDELLVVTEVGSQRNVVIFVDDGSLSFTAYGPVVIPVGPGVTRPVVGNFNEDLIPDLAIVDNATGIHVLLGDHLYKGPESEAVQ